MVWTKARILTPEFLGKYGHLRPPVLRVLHMLLLVVCNLRPKAVCDWRMSSG